MGGRVEEAERRADPVGHDHAHEDAEDADAGQPDALLDKVELAEHDVDVDEDEHVAEAELVGVLERLADERLEELALDVHVARHAGWKVVPVNDDNDDDRSEMQKRTNGTNAASVKKSQLV